MEDEDFLKDAFIDLMEEDKAFIEQEFKESSSQKIKREFSLVEHEFKEEIKMEIETWGKYRYSESSAGSSAASGDEEMIVSRKRSLSIRSDIEEMDEDEEEELRVLPLVAIEEGPDYVDFIKMSKSDPNHPKVKITKDLQMEWSQELAKVSKTKIYESGMFLSVLYPHILLPKIHFGNILHIALPLAPKMYFVNTILLPFIYLIFLQIDKNHKKITKDLILIPDTKLRAR